MNELCLTNFDMFNEIMSVINEFRCLFNGFGHLSIDSFDILTFV